MKPIYHPFAILALFVLCLISAIVIWFCMLTDWVAIRLKRNPPFGIIKGIKDLEATDTDAYIQ